MPKLQDCLAKLYFEILVEMVPTQVKANATRVLALGPIKIQGVYNMK